MVLEDAALLAEQLMVESEGDSGLLALFGPFGACDFGPLGHTVWFSYRKVEPEGHSALLACVDPLGGSHH